MAGNAKIFTVHESGKEMKHSIMIYHNTSVYHITGSGKQCLAVYHSRKIWRNAKISIIHKADAKDASQCYN